MATGATEFFDNTTQDNFIPEYWSPLLLEARESNLLFASMVDRRFEAGLSKGDTIHVNDVPLLAARSKSENTAITYETVNFSFN